jgi:hypothetical protein
MDSKAYNDLIKDLGTRFEEFSTKELASICDSLSLVGLRQEDIFKSTIERIKTLATGEDKYSSPF